MSRERLQEIANRGLQDKLDPDKRARFDEAVNRGLITLPQATNTNLAENFQRNVAAIGDFINPPSEGFPEIDPNRQFDRPGIVPSLQVTSDPEQQLKLLNERLPQDQQVTLSQDQFGNPAFEFPSGEKFFVNRPGPSLNDADFFMRKIEQFAPLVAGGSATAGTKFLTGVGANVALGAGTEALQQSREALAGARDEADLRKVGEEGLLAGAGEGAGRIISNLGGRLMARIGRALGRSDPVTEFITPEGKITEKGLKMLKDSELTPDELGTAFLRELRKGSVDADAAARLNQFREGGLDPTLAQVTRKADDFSFQQQAVRSDLGDPLIKRLDQQNSALISKADELKSATGGATDIRPDTGLSINQAVVGKADAVQEKVTQAYARARELAKNQPTVTFKELTEAIDDVEGFDTASGGMAKAFRAELEKRGITTGTPVTVETAEQIRQVANVLHDDANPVRTRVLRNIRDAIDNDVDRSIGQDIFKDARAAKRAFHQEFTDGRTGRFDIKAKNKLSKVLDGSLEPEKTYEAFITNGTRKELTRLKKTLLTAGDQGRQAWNDIKGQALQDAFDAAQKGGRNELGDIVFNSKEFKKTIDRLNSKGMLGELFSETELSEIAAFIRLGDLRQPVTAGGVSTALGAGPTSPAVQKLARLMGKTKIGQILLGANRQLTRFADDQAIKQGVQEALRPEDVARGAFRQALRIAGRSQRVLPTAGAIGAQEANE